MVHRINRNIVECKYILEPCWSAVLAELIETLWNVNTGEQKSIADVRGINRNIVECKSCCDYYFTIKGKRINRNIVECKLSSI